MAEGWMTRACALAIATAACVGLPAALVYAIARVAAARRFGATFALAIVLVFWVTISLAYYPRVCCDIVPWSALLRRLRCRRNPRGGEVAAFVAAAILPPPLVPGGGARVRAADDILAAYQPRRRNGAGGLTLPLFEARGQGGYSAAAAFDAAEQPPPPPLVPGGARFVVGADDTLEEYEPRRRDSAFLLPLFVARGQGCYGGVAMAALPREPPAGHASARAADGGEQSKRRCAVCLYDVEEIETAAWLPACFHMFHRQCIDQWLHKHGHSTCPICRSDAFAAPPPLRDQTV